MDGNPKPTFSVGSAPTVRLRPSFFPPFVRNRDVKEKARAVVKGTARALLEPDRKVFVALLSPSERHE